MANLFTDRLLIHVEDIDEQHRRIFEIVEEFYSECMNGKNKDRILEIFRVLKGSLEEHFKSEEDYMVTYSYPEYEVHKERHNIFMLKLQALDSAFKGGFIPFTKLMEANEFFAEGFVTHISDIDSRLGEFLRDKL
ncbi:hemerythrin family protein [Clostridium sp. CX1]|uniref:Hemerythrin family protein n=1 Tax=Clostridium tanneri TaxID=3037988 RepID=A0ABU4JPB3_9CLOT|nr:MULTISPECIES: hemerythrin family protein [unclassified Clostridium]MCT8976333.1 hemerythrin family protein [Clostridium sp. CX1]MDW8799997.1 hemerythrin family protein [Clostridium sp. A1-XYC3]